MSLKAVELQIAIPKTFEAGKVADQHQQRVINQQIDANEALKKELERKQLTVNMTDNVEVIAEREGGSRNGGDPSSSEGEKKSEQEQPKAQHPFKGNLIDFSG